MKTSISILALFVGVFIQSSPVFASEPSVRVISPNGGEIWAVGETHTITWTQENVDRVKILLGHKLPISHAYIDFPVESFTALPTDNGNGTFSYTIPSGIEYCHSYNYYIYVTGINDESLTVVQDVSDEAFRILQSPTITSLSPSEGSIGSDITVNGSCFLTFTNSYSTITFEQNGISRDFVGASGTGYSRSFTVPEYLTIGGTKKVEAGNYNVSITTDHGRSNVVAFTVSGVPTVDLKVNEESGPNVTTQYGNLINIVWSSSHADYCKGYGNSFTGVNYGAWGSGNLPTNGTETFTLTSSNPSVGIQCFNSVTSADKSISITTYSASPIPENPVSNLSVDMTIAGSNEQVKDNSFNLPHMSLDNTLEGVDSAPVPTEASNNNKGVEPVDIEAVRSEIDYSRFIENAKQVYEEIEEIVVYDKKTEVQYKTRGKIFGFIPIKLVAKLTFEDTGDIKITYPWYYIFLSDKSEINVDDLEDTLRSSEGETKNGNVWKKRARFLDKVFDYIYNK